MASIVFPVTPVYGLPYLSGAHYAREIPKQTKELAEKLEALIRSGALQGPRGLPGTNGVPTDQAVAEYMGSAGTATNAAVQAVVQATARIGGQNYFAGKDAGALTPVLSEQSAPGYNGGYMNTFVGAEAGSQNQRGWKNTGLGVWALRNNVDGYNNVAVGDAAMEYNIGGIGDGAPSNTAPGSRNVAVGSYALRYNRTGWANVAIGRNAAHTNVSGAYNTAMGTNAYSGQYSNGVGDEKTASQNTAIGYNAAFFTNANNNTALGAEALYNNASGTENVAVGVGAGWANESGVQNTSIGTGAGRYTQSGGSSIAFNNCSTLGYNARISGHNQVQLGDSRTTTYVYGTVQNRSDARDKTDVRDTVLGLDFINLLRPVDYRWDMRDDYTEHYTAADPETGVQQETVTVEHERDGSRARARFHHGLIAQEVAKVISATGVDFGGFQDHSRDGGADVLTIGYDELIAPLIKAVQELAARVQTLESKEA